MTYYEEEDITNSRHWDYKCREEGITKKNNEKKITFSERKKRRELGYYLDIIITLGFLVIGVFGAIFIIKYGMPVGEDSFNIFGLKNITEMTSNTVNNITEMTTDSIKQTFNIQSKSMVGLPKYSIDFNNDGEYYFTCPGKIISSCNPSGCSSSREPSYDEKILKEYEEFKKENCYDEIENKENENDTKSNESENNNTKSKGRIISSNSEDRKISSNSEDRKISSNSEDRKISTNSKESGNNTKKEYTPIQFVKENSLTVAGSGFVAITASLHTSLVAFIPQMSFIFSFIYSTVVSNILLIKVLPDILKNYIDNEHLLLFFKIIFIVIDAVITLLFILIFKKFTFAYYMMRKSARFLRKNKGFGYGITGGILLFFINYIIIYILYGFISKFNHSNDPNDVTYSRILILVFLLFLYKYLNYKVDYTVRSGISECIYYIFIDHYNDIDNYSYMDISDEGLEIEKRIFKFGHTKYKDSICISALFKTIFLIVEIPLLCLKVIFFIPIILKNMYIRIYYYFKKHHCNILSPLLILILIVFAPAVAVIFIIDYLIKKAEIISNEDGEYIAVIIGMKNYSFLKAAKKKNKFISKELKRMIYYLKFITTFCFGFLKYSVLVLSIYGVIYLSNNVYNDEFKNTYQGIFSSVFVLIFSANKVIFDYMVTVPIQVTMQALLICACYSNGDTGEDGNEGIRDSLQSIHEKYKEKATGDIMDYLLDWFGDYAENQL